MIPPTCAHCMSGRAWVQDCYPQAFYLDFESYGHTSTYIATSISAARKRSGQTAVLSCSYVHTSGLLRGHLRVGLNKKSLASKMEVELIDSMLRPSKPRGNRKSKSKAGQKRLEIGRCNASNDDHEGYGASETTKNGSGTRPS